MNTQTEALKMAATLRAIGGYFDEAALKQISLQEVAECIEALAQPAQEPVAWIIQTEEQNGKISEPYALMGKYKHVSDACDFGEPIPLYTHPAPSWQGLSDDEKKKIWFNLEHEIGEHIVFGGKLADTIEQALKEKNHVI